MLFRRAINETSMALDFISTVPDKVVALTNSLSRPRHDTTIPLLQFSDPPASDTMADELDDWAYFANRRDAVVQQASRLENLQDSAAKSLDAADYALVRMRLELAEIAPSLVTDLPTLLAHERCKSVSATLASRALIGPASARSNLAP